MCKAIDNKKDILLLLLYSPGNTDQFNEAVIGKTRLVKMLFLFHKECLRHFVKSTRITEENFYEFFAWNFGPFSTQVYDDIMFFTLRGFIVEESTEEEVLPEAASEWWEWMRMSSPDAEQGGITDYDEHSFTLSDKGATFAKDLYGTLTTNQKKTLKTFKAEMNRRPLKAILQYVYDRYPDFTSHSKSREQVLGRK